MVAGGLLRGRQTGIGQGENGKMYIVGASRLRTAADALALQAICSGI